MNTQSQGDNNGSQMLFWGCFIALVTTAFGFISRVFLVDVWEVEFGLTKPEAGRLLGIGIWPFAVSIIGFSLIIDKIGYKASMVIAFVGHAIWAVMGVTAYFVSDGGNPQAGYHLVYWGSLILALGNGTVEAFINPVVATLFSREKTKWLNILHAGWPGGLVCAGFITIYIDEVPWWIKVGLIAIPAVVYFFMLLPCKFPVQERVASGVSYRQMLAEFGVLGAIIVGFLVTLQLMDFFSVGGLVELPVWQKVLFMAIGVAIVVAFGVYTRALGRGLMFVLTLIMMPLAWTELGTDSWITAIMKGVVTFDAGWILVYTSAIMLVLRFFAGPIVHKFSPLGLLAISAGLAIVGLYSLSLAAGAFIIFVAATIYGFGKTFFWPTMLGVVSEQCPRGGALTLNAIAGIGMLAVGTLGTPFIGKLQTDKQNEAIIANADIAEALPALVIDGEIQALEPKAIYEIINYDAIDDAKLKEIVATIPEEQREAVEKKIAAVRQAANQGALANMTIFPTIMLIGYLALIFYFRSRGGYRPVELSEEETAPEPAPAGAGVEEPGALG